MKRTVLTAALLLAAGLSTSAVAGELTIGDKAPKLEISHWLKGEQIDQFEKDKVYVVEFWATWCGPCIASMPHISELQEKYKDYDVTFIGVSDEPLQTVVGFLFKEHKGDKKIHNDRTHYTLTTDPDKSVYKAYMEAAGQRGIPTAFIVGKDQKIEWIGHPMSIDKPLDAVVRDSWDRTEAKKKFESKAQMQKDFEKAFELLATADGAKEGYEIAKRVAEYYWEEPMALNQIAWYIVDDENVKVRDLDFALKTALQANKLTEEKNAAILDTVARVYYEKGDLKNALKWQTLAVKHAEEGPMADDLKKALEKYQKAAGR